MREGIGRPADESHTVIESGASGPRGAGGAPIELARGTLLAGRYEIRRLLGRGGVGVVVQARDRALGEDVAVKVLQYYAEALDGREGVVARNGKESSPNILTLRPTAPRS